MALSVVIEELSLRIPYKEFSMCMYFILTRGSMAALSGLSKGDRIQREIGLTRQTMCEHSSLTALSIISGQYCQACKSAETPPTYKVLARRQVQVHSRK